MSNTIRLSTPDGELVFKLDAGAVCAWFLGCRKPAVQMRRHAVLDPVPVCVDHTEHADRFTPPAAVHEFDVPGVDPVTVVFGRTVPPLGCRTYRLIIGGVIEVERQDYPADNTYQLPLAGVVVLGAVARSALSAGRPWRAPVLAFAERAEGHQD